MSSYEFAGIPIVSGIFILVLTSLIFDFINAKRKKNNGEKRD